MLRISNWLASSSKYGDELSNGYDNFQTKLKSPPRKVSTCLYVILFDIDNRALLCMHIGSIGLNGLLVKSWILF